MKRTGFGVVRAFASVASGLVLIAVASLPLACGPQSKSDTPSLAPAPAPLPPPAKGKPTVFGQFGETSLEISFEDLRKLVPLAEGETFKIAEVARDATSSYHVVALLGAEPLHKHVTHDLTVVQLEGEGEMLIGRTTRPIGPHSIVHIPRGAIHSMRNTEKTPLIGYAIFTPPFDGKDRVAASP